MNWPFGKLRPLSYEVIVADPPWRFDLYSEKGNLKAASHHYDTMSLSDIMALPVGHLARDNALLLLWSTGWAMATGQALAVCKAWDAEPVTELIWLKTYASGARRTGPGYRARTRHEPLLLAKWGNPKHVPFPSDFLGVAQGHSRKPDEFYTMVRSHTAGQTRCDLFSAGIMRPGFNGWGEDHRDPIV